MHREWQKLEYYIPERILLGFREIAETHPLHELPYPVASLRTRDLKLYLQSRQCALFCYGISKFLDIDVSYAHYEDSDYDFVIARQEGDTIVYTPIQMKELVPETVNKETTLSEELEKLKKYVSPNLVVAVHINRAGRLDLDELDIPDLNIGELWFFGSNQQDQQKWFLAGNMLREPRLIEFEYPKP